MPRNTPQRVKGERRRVTEKNAYITSALKDLQWDIRNPSRHPQGQVYTDNQALEHPELRKGLVRDKPDNIVKVSETTFWIVESKSNRNDIEIAVREAVDYAKAINEASSMIQAVIISGVAGNDDDGYLIRSEFLYEGRFTPIRLNEKDVTGLLSPEIVRRLLEEAKPSLADVPIDETIFLTTAEGINEELHRGAINKNDRARVMAALLLALVDDTIPNIDANPYVLISDINSRAEAVLKRNSKGAFFRFVQIQLPAAEDNHVKFRRALVRTIQALTNLNIRSAMSSGTDLLGKFYEVFLKYGNGAKEIGIVLTPRHITRFAAEVMDIDYRDVLLDPACGTGGFLVAALDYVRSKFLPDAPQVEQFKRHGIFGVDQDPVVTALAIVNMIFRNDGKNHIIEGNAFAKHLQRWTQNGMPSAQFVSTVPSHGQEGATKILMNPPFALKPTEEREYLFVETALTSLNDGGLLFAVLPISSMVEGGTPLRWRRDILLAHHTLLAVLSFPEELFYPVANQTVALIIKKGFPHERLQPVFWARIVNDGFRKSKGKRLPLRGDIINDLDQVKPILRIFLAHQQHHIQNVPETIKITAVDFSDPYLELVPEAYVDSMPLTAEHLAIEVDRLVRENAAFLIRGKRREG